MALFIVVLNGARIGTKLTIREGLSIGRKSGDLLLNEDAKVSGSHAKVETDNKSQLVLKDQGSANGMVLDGRKVRKIALLPGVTFQIGNTRFRVIKDEGAPEPQATPKSIRAVEESDEATVFSAPPADIVTEPKPPVMFKPIQDVDMPNPSSKKNRPWKARITELIDQQKPLLLPESEHSIHVEAFSPVLLLNFVEGLQADTMMTLGYGPREAGFSSLDIDLLDPWIPRKAFELSPGPGSVQIRDLTNGKVLLNNRQFETAFLEEEDTISIGKTKIKVRYL